jgi:hypothetical protein
MCLLLLQIALEALPESLLYDWFYDLETHKWEKWMARVPTYTEPSPFKYVVLFPLTLQPRSLHQGLGPFSSLCCAISVAPACAACLPQ